MILLKINKFIILNYKFYLIFFNSFVKINKIINQYILKEKEKVDINLTHNLALVATARIIS